jgi:hypothetical protein
MNNMEQSLSSEKIAEKRRFMSAKIIGNFENKTCINCNKWAGGSSVPGWEDGFCSEDCRRAFLEVDPANELFLQAAKADMKSLEEKTRNDHDSMIKTLVAGIENNVCLNCGKNGDGAVDNRGDGFCNKTCHDNFLKSDTQNERYLKEAEDTVNYNRHLSIEAKNMTEEFGRLQKIETREKVPVEKLQEEEKTYKKAA